MTEGRKPIFDGEHVKKNNVTQLRVDIRRNAYDEQSHRIIWIWSARDSKWNLLWSLPFDRAHCHPVSYVQTRSKVDIRLFEKDEAELLERAKEILLMS